MDYVGRNIYARDPVYEVDGLPVFIKSDRVKEVDEYAEGNCCLEKDTYDTEWDRFRIDTIVDNCSGEVVLDVGCGEGQLTSALCSKYEVRATDISLTAVRLNYDKNPAACFCVADVMDLPYTRGQFDCIIAANLFEHLEAPCTFVHNIDRLLRKGGRLILSTPSRYRLANFRRVLMGKPVKFNSDLHVTEYTVGQVEEMLRRCGFRLRRVITNLKRQRLAATLAVRVLQSAVTRLHSRHKFGDPTVFVAERE